MVSTSNRRDFVVLIKTARDSGAMALEVGGIANDLKPHTGFYSAITLEHRVPARGIVATRNL